MIDLNKNVLKREKVLIPEWTEDEVYVQELTGRQVELLKKYVTIVNGIPVAKHEIALMIILSLVDKDGNYLFTEDDIEQLENQPIALIIRLYSLATKLSGLSGTVDEAKKNLKNFRKNSSTVK